MRIDIADINIGNRLRVFTSRGLIIGTVVDILLADVKPDIQKVLAYYQIDSNHTHFEAFCLSIKLDRLIIEKDNGDYFVLPRTNKADRYLLDIQMVN